MLRQRKGVKEIVEVVKNLDAFPKIEEDYQETSWARGTISIVVFIVIAFLVASEFNYYSEKELQYNYEVDFDHDSKMKFNIDITVAMPCKSIGADVLDSTSRDILTDQQLNEQDTWFELSPNQQLFHDAVAAENKRVRDDYHALHNMMLRSNYMNIQLPPREMIPFEKPRDACRFFGTLELTKVAGNFHIIFGRSVSFFGNHAHMSFINDDTKYNFSHRIDHFSIGDLSPGIFYPLNGELKVNNDSNKIYQYFVQAVPTKMKVSSFDVDTYQYSVTEQERVVSHEKNSHGIPGIFFKYDISSIKINVQETHKSYFEFLIRLIGIIGGIFATTSMFNASFQASKEFLNSCFGCKISTNEKISLKALPKDSKVIKVETNPLLNILNNEPGANTL